MNNNTRYEVFVKTGRKSGASHPIPLGELSIGTTLDSEFFIGCVDMWAGLLSADASADSRSASASVDALPEQLMHVTLTNGAQGLVLRVEQGFVEFAQRRLLPGQSCEVTALSSIRIGASELEIRPIKATMAKHSGVGHEQLMPANFPKSLLLPTWFSNRVVMTVLTVGAASILSIAIVMKEPPAREFSTQSPVDVHNGMIGEDKIVAVVSSSPAFLMTASGARYSVGAKLEDGFRISQITAELVEFTRGSKIKNHVYGSN